MCAANIDQFQRKQEEAQPQAHGPGKATVRRHGSGRRHTLQNGVDQNMVRIAMSREKIDQSVIGVTVYAANEKKIYNYILTCIRVLLVYFYFLFLNVLCTV